MIFRCPECGTPVADISSIGTERPICPQCLLHYEVLTGEVVAVSSRPLTAGGRVTTGGGPRGEEYDVRLDTGAEVRDFRVRVGADAQRIAVLPGELASVVHLRAGEKVGELLSLLHLPSFRQHDVAKPGANAKTKGCMAGCGLGLGVLLAMGIAGAHGLLAFLVGGAAAYGAYVWVRDRDAPRVRVSEAGRRVLDHRRGLLERKLSLLRTLHGLYREREEKMALVERLLALRAKMEKVGLELYGARITAVAAGLSTLERQVALDDRLIEGYEKTVTIIEIELESGATAEAIPGDLAVALAGRQAELDALAEEHRELERQLAANDEVERLLRSG